MTGFVAVVGLSVIVVGLVALEFVVALAIGYQFGVNRRSIWGRLARLKRRVAR